MTVLVLNSGSSSIKYQLVDPDSGEAIASGLVERIGESVGHYEHRYKDEVTEIDEPIEDHAAGLKKVVDLFNEVGPSLTEAGIKAIGHRVVQGGRYFSKAALIDDAVHAKIEELIPLAPLHNPPNLKGIDEAKILFPGIPNVAVFDTAFFQDLPTDTALYALDREVADKYEIRRYGAHGTSHKYVSGRVREILGRDDLKQIVLHLGNGASASAVSGTHAIDTSMGLTPLAGLVMGTRTGDIDAATVFHLQRVAGMTVDEIDTLMNKASGLKGLAGDNDMRNILERSSQGDQRAQEALDIYVTRIVHYIGAYAAEMGGLDVITFTAGVGENAVLVRAKVMDRLANFGVTYDPEVNATRSKEPRVITSEGSSIKVMVVPTNEELAIARESMELLG